MFGGRGAGKGRDSEKGVSKKVRTQKEGWFWGTKGLGERIVPREETLERGS